MEKEPSQKYYMRPNDFSIGHDYVVCRAPRSWIYFQILFRILDLASSALVAQSIYYYLVRLHTFSAPSYIYFNRSPILDLWTSLIVSRRIYSILSSQFADSRAVQRTICGMSSLWNHHFNVRISFYIPHCFLGD
jgi:hypothetical protein